MRNDARIELIRNVWLFERCTNKELDEIAKLATPLDLPAGKVLATQGERGREFFAIVSGKVEATRDGTTIGTLGSGSFFGEMSLLESLPRVATVTTIEPTSVLVLDGQAFNSLVASMPSVDRNMLIVLAHRLRDVEDRYVTPNARLVPTVITEHTRAGELRFSGSSHGAPRAAPSQLPKPVRERAPPHHDLGRPLRPGPTRIQALPRVYGAGVWRAELASRVVVARLVRRSGPGTVRRSRRFAGSVRRRRVRRSPYLRAQFRFRCA